MMGCSGNGLHAVEVKVRFEHCNGNGNGNDNESVHGENACSLHC